MRTASGLTYTASDMKWPEVLDEARGHPVSVRDTASGEVLVLIPKDLVDSSNEVLEYVQLFTRIVVECQRTDPSALMLGKADYVAAWSPERRLRFIRGYAEALSASVSDDHPAAIAAYVEFLACANDPIPPVFDSAILSATDRKLIDEHMQARSSKPVTARQIAS